MSPLVDLTINAALADKEREFDEAMAMRTAREQHWAGRAGRGGDVSPESRLALHEVLEDRLDLSHMDEADLRHAARTLRAAFPDDDGMKTLSAHIESWEMFAAEEAEKREWAQMGTQESTMTKMLLAGLGEAYREDVGRRWPPDHSGKFHEPLGVPKSSSYLPYPTATEPEPIDEDRKARGATQPSMSEKLRGLAAEVSRLSKLSGNPRQRNRLSQRAAELQRMALRQYSREMENDLATSGDPDEPNNVMGRLAADMDDEARAAGAQPEDSFRSFDDWDNEDRAGSEQRAEDDVALQLDEDIPTMPDVPRAGRRFGEDQVPPENIRDEPRGLRRNRADDDILQRVRKGTARFGAGQPRVGDRFGGERRRYSAESLRESDLTAQLLDDLAAADFAAHSHF